jgi:hypothetical protein
LTRNADFSTSIDDSITAVLPYFEA